MSLKKMPRKLEMNTINFGFKEGKLGCFKEIKVMCANWSMWGDMIWNDRIWHTELQFWPMLAVWIKALMFQTTIASGIDVCNQMWMNEWGAEDRPEGYNTEIWDWASIPVEYQK